MARFQDTDEAEDVAGHGNVSEHDDLAPIGGAMPRRPKVAGDDDDTEGHLFGTGPSTQGEAFPHPSDNPHGD